MEELFEVRINQLKLLQVRGYSVPSQQWANVADLETFIRNYGTNPGQARATFNEYCVYGSPTVQGTAAYIRYLLPIEGEERKTKAISNKAVAEIVAQLMKETTINFTSIIFIVQLSYSPSAAKTLNTQSAPDCEVQLFEESELLYNPLEHSLVPSHKIIPIDEEDKLLKRMKITKDKLPEALDNDPVIKFLGCQVGRIVEISRKQIFLPVLASKTVFYRRVIRGF